MTGELTDPPEIQEIIGKKIKLYFWVEFLAFWSTFVLCDIINVASPKAM